MPDKKTFTGEIKAKIIELRFAFSGKVVSISAKKGDLVKKGQAIAFLDRKVLQMDLDRQLADFEKTRADFEIFNLQKGEPTDDISKYLKTQKQASLNSSVKEVELAKAKLDQANLISPVEGIIIEDNNIEIGINITPASNPIRILDTKSYFLEFEIEQKDLELFKEPVKLSINVNSISKPLKATTDKIKPSLETKPGKFLVKANLETEDNLILGMVAKVKIV